MKLEKHTCSSTTTEIHEKSSEEQKLKTTRGVEPEAQDLRDSKQHVYHKLHYARKFKELVGNFP